MFEIFIKKTAISKRARKGWRRQIVIGVIQFGAKAGFGECALTLGKAYLNNRFFPRSDYDAAYWLYKAALLGRSEAQYLLGSLYLSGLPVEKISLEYQGIAWHRVRIPNFEEGIKWVKKATDQGHTQASGKLGDLLLNGPQKIRNTREGIRLLLFAAKNDLPSAKFSLGNFFIMTPTDDASMRRVAASYISRSASQNYPPAIYVKGLLLENGFGIARDRKSAAFCFKAASEFNIPEAMRKYATELITGEFFLRNILLAETVLRKSACSGDLESAKILSQYYAEGIFFHKNPIQASFWRHQAIFFKKQL